MTVVARGFVVLDLLCSVPDQHTLQGFVLQIIRPFVLQIICPNLEQSTA